MWGFAEDEITLPDTGPFAGRKFRCEYQPFSRLWFQGIASGLFNTHAATGPSQTGKTLSVCVIPAMFHLFEIGETAIFFSPNMDINEDKWLVDIKPTIEKSQYARFLPRTGRGSQGGFNELIEFGNGARLKFMTGGGGDKNKAAFTSRVAIGTEIDGMDTASETSRETDPIRQILARLRSHGRRYVAYLDCTVSTPEGRIWKEVKGGSDSRIALECPHCFKWVTLERDSFIGWEMAETEIQAESLGRFYCSECGTAWSTEQRKSANQNCKLVHKGQEITAGGNIVGPVPETRTFGFRWSAVNNMFTDEAQLGAEEWAAARNPDRDAAEKERCQFVWAIPFTGESEAIEINEDMVAGRLTGIPRGVLPDDTETLVCQVDLHDRWHYWTVMAVSPNDVRSVVDYGLHLTPNPDINGPIAAIRMGLEELGGDLEARKWKTQSGELRPLDLKFVDAGYQQDIGLEFITGNPGWRLVKGQEKGFDQPKEKSDDIRPGHHWFDSRQLACEASSNKKWWLVISDTNYFMRQIHAGFAMKTFNDDGTRRPGSIALFGDDPAIHKTVVDKSVARSAYATQLLGWKWEETKSPKGVTVLDWVCQWKQDHWFDTSYGCLVADLVVRKYHKRFKVKPVEQVKPVNEDGEGFRMPDGRPYLITER